MYFPTTTLGFTTWRLWFSLLAHLVPRSFLAVSMRTLAPCFLLIQLLPVRFSLPLRMHRSRLGLIFVVLWCLCSVPAWSLPQFSLITGNRCINCHVNAQGGGLRNELGWYSSHDVGLIEPRKLGLESLYSSDKGNSFLDDKLFLGMDVRFQMARSHVSAESERKFFPMQFALYGAYKATDWLTGEFTYSMRGRNRFYPGQEQFMGSLILQPMQTLPALRVGYIQPSIGIRYDDHTMLTRFIVGNVPLIPPNYAEWGAELNYESLPWLTLNAGVFRARNLADIGFTDAISGGFQDRLITNPNALSLTARAVLWQRFAEDFVNTYIGASFFRNDDFSIAQGFAGIGLTDMISLMAEYTASGKRSRQQTRNFSVEAMYQVLPGLNVYVRGERGMTTNLAENRATNTIAPQDVYMNQGVIGAQVFILPYVEVRPEYRIQDTDTYRSTRWAMQLHIFY
jgi:hypothetical protein